ncbi:MAG: ATP-grasp domain-containing protein [Candidatus Heimdallarchaeota archaeon]
MKIFIQEYASGGGLVKEDLSANLLVEGFGILRVLIDNCKRLGYKVTTTLDKRLTFLSHYLKADTLKMVTKDDSLISKGLEELDSCNYSLIVAPGISGTLSTILDNYSKSSAITLNSNTQAVNFVTSKIKAYKHCSKHGIRFPRTRIVQVGKPCSEINRNTEMKAISGIESLEDWNLTYPVLVKPDDGVACEGIVLCQNGDELKEKLTNNSDTTLLVQDFIFGDNVSVLLYIIEDQIHFLSINEQILSLGNEKSEYLGGISNIRHSFAHGILSFCEQLLSTISGLQGFIGIDLIISAKNDGSKEITFIEINPRATTSICGLMNSNNKPVEIFPKSISPFAPKQKNVTYFAKAKFNFPLTVKHRIYSGIKNHSSIVTPPISFDKQTVYSLVRGSGDSSRKANRNFNRNLVALSNKLKKAFLAKYQLK